MKTTIDNKLMELLQKQWSSKDMVNHCYKKTEYIQHDGKYIAIGDKKPSITKTLWFDDEYDIPNSNEQLFIDTNMRTNAPKPMESTSYHGDPLIIIAEYCNDRTQGELCGITYDTLDRYPGAIVVSESLLNTINSVKAEMAVKYEKRLRSYWKRYNKNVSCRGYWANR